MRRVSLALLASVALAGCVQTRQYADVEFTPPQGDYKLLVMRPDVNVGSVTTGGMVEPRADWTEQARANFLTALRAQQAGRGGNVFIMDRRDSLQGVDPDTIAELDRLHYAVASSIALHRYSGYYLPTKRNKGLDWTLGEDAVALPGMTAGVDCDQPGRPDHHDGVAVGAAIGQPRSRQEVRVRRDLARFRRRRGRTLHQRGGQDEKQQSHARSVAGSAPHGTARGARTRGRSPVRK